MNWTQQRPKKVLKSLKLIHENSFRLSLSLATVAEKLIAS